MKRIGAAMVGFLCLAVAAVHAANDDWDLNMEPFKASITAAKEVVAKEREIALAGYVVSNDPQAGEPSKPVEFVLIDGGKFTMAINDPENGNSSHEVTIKAFNISETLVTVEQYAECVIKGQCEAPVTADACNWGKKDRQRHPINCVSWKEANDFAKFMGARLPSEAEYEYAATSKGKKRPYPWGRSKATCEKAVMYGNGGHGCGSGGTMPVCSTPKGNTEQGLCDMVGNLWQWVGDTWHVSYEGAPADGSAWQDGGEYSYRVFRGGSFSSKDANLRTDSRNGVGPWWRYAIIGFRLARS